MSTMMNTFEMFIEDESNLFAVAACKAIPEHIGIYYNPLWIYGPSGCGKTHLLHAINLALDSQNQPDVLYIDARDLAESLVDYVANKLTLWGYIKQVDVLLVDNMECLRGCKTIQTEIAKLFLEKSQNGQQVVCVSNCSPSKLSAFFKMLQKNAEKALIADIQPPDLILRQAFIRQYLRNQSIEMTEEAVQYLSRRLTTIPKIIGVLNTAKSRYIQENRSINVEIIKRCERTNKFHNRFKK